MSSPPENAGEHAGADAVEDAGESCVLGGESFTAGTKVLLASGKAVPISSLKPGEKVLATNTRTGKTQAETISVVMVHHDTNLYDLKIRTKAGTSVIHTTSNHLFWDPYLHQWRSASKLKKGERLKTPDGTIATADGGTTPKVHDGWMWDLTVPGNNDHDFYVVPTATQTLILVHNSSGCMDASLDDEGEDLYDLADRSNEVDPVGQPNGNFARIVTAPRIIGTDVETGLPTKVYTVIQDVWGWRENDASGDPVLERISTVKGVVKCL